jgi:hypothetical protein
LILLKPFRFAAFNPVRSRVSTALRRTCLRHRRADAVAQTWLPLRLASLVGDVDQAAEWLEVRESHPALRDR